MSETKTVYLSGDWIFNEKVKETAAELEKAGFTIAHKWWDPASRKETTASMGFYLEKIRGSDAFVLDLRGIPENECRHNAGGHIGLGAAIALGKPVFFMGQPTSSLYFIAATSTKGLIRALRDELA